MTDPALAPSHDPTSYAYQEGILGIVPNFIRIGSIRVHSGAGVPSASLGANGDFYLRSDGAVGASTTIYFKAAGAWSGLVA